MIDKKINKTQLSEMAGITTNYNRNQLRERLCINKNYSIVDSIISRLYEMCGGIEIKDDDHRMSDSLIRKSL